MRKGFSLLEILIIAAIIAAVCAIAIPSFIIYRINANEAAAIANLRMLHGVLATWAAAHNGTYPWSLAFWWSGLYSSNPRYLNDPAFGSGDWWVRDPWGGGTKQGYSYWYQVGTWDDAQERMVGNNNYVLYAVPSEKAGLNTWRFNGRRSFRLWANGQIEWVRRVSGGILDWVMQTPRPL